MTKPFVAIDTHTHTVLSGHGFSTLLENVRAAREKGLYGIVMTEHAPAIEGGAPSYVSYTAHGALPEFIEGVRVYRGAEANITDGEGTIDIPAVYLPYSQFVLASLHSIVFKGLDDYTDAIIGALNNPHVDAIGHPGNPRYPMDAERVVAEAKRLNKCLEINSHSFSFRKGSRPVCERIIGLCRDNGVRVCVGSDAHFVDAVGRVDESAEALTRLNFPDELIINKTKESFEGYLREREARIGEVK